MRFSAKLLVGLAFASSSSVVAAQGNLGELLDAGATRVSAEDFRREIVQRTVAGATPTGGTIEVMYVTNGTIQGVGTPPVAPQLAVSFAPIRGEWTIDDGDRVCAAMQILSPQYPGVILPKRCQAWFKLGNDYFLSDSDSDRRTKVLRRTIKSASIVAPQQNLGALLDAGAKRVSAEEFRRNIVRRKMVGPPVTGGRMDIVYATDGSVSGRGTHPIRQVVVIPASIAGKWTIDESARVCTTEMKIGEVDLPNRCEFWFKLGEIYYVSESDTDRQAYAFPRTPNP